MRRNHRLDHKKWSSETCGSKRVVWLCGFSSGSGLIELKKKETKKKRRRRERMMSFEQIACVPWNCHTTGQRLNDKSWMHEQRKKKTRLLSLIRAKRWTRASRFRERFASDPGETGSINRADLRQYLDGSSKIVALVIGASMRVKKKKTIKKYGADRWIVRFQFERNRSKFYSRHYWKKFYSNRGVWIHSVQSCTKVVFPKQIELSFNRIIRWNYVLENIVRVLRRWLYLIYRSFACLLLTIENRK